MAVKKKVSPLTKRAVENTTIKKAVAKEEPVVLKAGVPVDHTRKHDPKTTQTTVGMSKGITKNMGDFESLRIDVWLSDNVRPDETPEQAIERVESFIDTALENALYNTIGDE